LITLLTIVLPFLQQRCDFLSPAKLSKIVPRKGLDDKKRFKPWFGLDARNYTR
jgi:hypothetical protein